MKIFLKTSPKAVNSPILSEFETFDIIHCKYPRIYGRWNSL